MSAACSHGHPFVDPNDPLVKVWFDEIAQFYLEAARRLPIADIPYLAKCLLDRGLAVGLCDPVTNILLTTIYAFAQDKEDFPRLIPKASKEEALKQTNDKLTFVEAIYSSRLALIQFMMSYFRYLTYEEAERNLDIASHNLPRAVLLVEKSCGSSLGLPDPFSATTKIALESASYMTRCSAQNLLHLMTSRYDPLAVATFKPLFCGSAQLTEQQVIEICDLLLPRQPRQPRQLPPPIPVLIRPTFRDSNGQVTTTIEVDTHLIPHPVVSGGVSRTIITSQSPTSHITSPSPTSHGDAVPLSTLAIANTTRGAQGQTVPLSTLAISNTTTGAQGQTGSSFLRLSLLDTMHELYLTALSQLPMGCFNEGHFTHAILTAGHAYGPMLHPVANIMFNTIWYHTIYPFHLDLPAADILDPRCMSLVESRSLHGIVALITTGTSASTQEALFKLCKDRGDLRTWSQDLTLLQRNIYDALLAAKHPLPNAYATFIRRLTLDAVCDMRGLMMMNHVISDDALCKLQYMIRAIAAPTNIAAPALSKSTLETMRAFIIQQDYVRKKLESLLGSYSRLKGQQYHVGLICGVASQSYYNNTKCYHVNFLANMDSDVPNDATPTPTPMHKLFFAEFWNRSDRRVEESTKPPICCDVQDYHGRFGRCNVCESTSSTLVHPPYCGYFMAPRLLRHQGMHLRSAHHELDQRILDIWRANAAIELM